jgi:hypothetical protein
MITKSFTTDVTKENCIFLEKWVRINVFHHMNDASKYIICDKDSMSVQLELEPNNSYDKNAIKVIGLVKKLFGTKRYFIGYVPAEISAYIYKKDFQNKLNTSLIKISYNEGFAELVSPSINIVISIFVIK